MYRSVEPFSDALWNRRRRPDHDLVEKDEKASGIKEEEARGRDEVIGSVGRGGRGIFSHYFL